MTHEATLIFFADDFTRYAEVNFLFKKSDPSQVLQTFGEKINTATK